MSKESDVPTGEAFEEEMARVIWRNRWETPNRWELYLRDHLTHDGARVFALEHCVFANAFPRWFAVGGLEAARGPAVKRLGSVTPHDRKSWAPLNLPESALAHWKAGEAADFPEGGHGDMTLKILAKYADTAEKQAIVLSALEESTQVRWYHFDQIGRDAYEASKVALPS